MRNWLYSTGLLLALIATAASAADSRIGQNCNLQTLGSDDKTGFLRFDHDLRFALDSGDAAAVALLVQFPLTVNTADGSHITLRDASTLQKQFVHVFPRVLRTAVSKQPLDDLFCRPADGVGYDQGHLWVNLAGASGKQFRIVAVNVPGPAPRATNVAHVELACSTARVRVVVDSSANSAAARYRAWNLPRGIEEKPDLETVGTKSVEGTSPCTHRMWTFRQANAVYTLSEPGCDPDAPAGAVAQLQVSIGGNAQPDAWCY